MLRGDLSGVTEPSSIIATASLGPVDNPDETTVAGDPVKFFNLPSDAVAVVGNGFTVRLDPALVPPGYVADGGLVTLFLDVATGEGFEAHHVATVQRVGSDGDASWADPLAQAPSRAATQSRVDPLPAPPREAVQLVDVSDVRAASGVEADYTAMDGAQCVYGSATNRSATVGTSYPVGKRSRSWLTYGSSSNTTFGAAVTYGNGWSASGSKTVGDSWGQNFSPSRHLRSYRVTIRYRKQTCYFSSGIYSHSHWLAWYETGGTAVNRLGRRPDWSTCQEIASGEWWRGRTRGSDYALSYGVKFRSAIGTDLRTQRSYTTDSRLWYRKPARRRLCGNTQYPAVASKIRERGA